MRDLEMCIADVWTAALAVENQEVYPTQNAVGIAPVLM
jgi:hypothetical protein